MPAPTSRTVALSPELERQRIITVKQAAELRSESEDNFKRNNPDLLIKLSPRRLGVRLGDALMLKETT
jgi:hypothetical protein